MDPRAEEFRRFIEVEVLKIIKKLSEKGGEGVEEKIQQVAQRTLDLIKPEMGIDELYRNAVKLDDQHPELAPVVFHIMKAYEEHFAKKGLENVSQLVKQGKYDDAQHMVKKILEFKMSN
ncbi:hypothetical protein HYT33_04665 [Candidatus Roizmanbacteria bacterium]|nr:hypothetical protein [Candidatus Roizmanbacteria bacterium]